ncbi:MAG: XTP/dITP diphosphatase [Lachnospiraceae bacterium]|nr:XTP/dITP diphosphatase [Lachnospiraceae bacterium]
MKKKLVFATGNANKTREFREMLDPEKYEVFSMKEAGIEVDIVEDGQTFEENALIKARAVAAHTDSIVVADDSGLEIDAFGGEPGVHSARYLGEDTPDEIKNQTILERMAEVPKEKRGARFVCAIAAVLPDGRELATKGVIEGYIGDKPMGENGFGYDPIFYVERYGVSTAAISPEQKNEISHRGQALRQMRDLLETL